LIDRGGGVVYDDDLHITWLADANYAKTSGHDQFGLLTWEEAMTWAENLEFMGATEWRLPTSDPSCFEFGCANSEMGHLFYNELGGSSDRNIFSSTDPDLALFQNIQTANGYWSSTQSALDVLLGRAQSFYFGNGAQGPAETNFFLYAWAVHDGDPFAPPIPIPPALYLFGTALLGLIGVARRKVIN